MTRSLKDQTLIIASHNKGKVAEIADLLAPFGLDVISAGALNLPEPEETGLTYIANAELKALAAAEAANKPALADDSGLSVNALGGAPGIYSARWAGADKDFDHAMKRVADALLMSGTTDRSAEFVCALTLAWPDGHKVSFEGRVGGTIAWPARGENGFGYDPIFVPTGYDITFGEMDPDKKHAMSHRAVAFAQLVDHLKTDSA
jgi:XTP/dITP diphosphohydrolase